MKQPWIHNAKTDFCCILMPPFLVLAFVILCHGKLQDIESKYSFFTWLFLIVFIDVAHVYSTLFKTYFIKDEFVKRKSLFITIPLLSLLIGFIFFQIGDLFFWSALALVAVFHFIRQQYGFMRIYSRFEKDRVSGYIDKVAIYSATIYPMLFWFCTPRNFTWFVEDEFSWLADFSSALPILRILYFLILLCWIGKTTYYFVKNKVFNIPKNLLILGTFLSWYFGIVYYNNDLIFTLLNVISHGIPYMALIYIQEIKHKDKEQLKKLKIFKSGIGILLFIIVVIGLAFSEELLWEVMVWKEHLKFTEIIFPAWIYYIIVPLLVVPQLTHYLLDGFIWRRNKTKYL
ncbi:hypothetical protein HZP84_14885 [Elizabethkingia anophelis]|uniref:Uncharacterized protein n=3 Tax=Elizabethkingia anophelis TaxID=1117645 RepID=A0A7Z7LVB1_9FLAO|nr:MULTISPECIES: hypothetical protein [Elizabethkingia]AQW90937.1 hypothetical protein BBD28_09780 [Elizabethkingia anophelis]ATC36422.1 hypothetical protein BAZ09_009465 [Elizabethkingia anophelis R26]ATC40099.1 hypothetical protein EAAG1_009680 [Elizabethkingia anophelis Ag1]ATC43778.1 hypothetical protein CMV41_09680 [Elizabethkingia anophelis]ATC47454.1 hypothetical protein CMV40_09680 [Elizabethkingia anophelis]